MLHLQEGEVIEAKAHKHWFILFRDSIGLFFVFLFPFVVWRVVQNNITVGPEQQFLSSVEPGLLLFLGSAWALLVWMKFFAVWTDYFLDIWIVTDRRIVNIDQKGLFWREESTLRIERIQDVTLEINGIIATVLNFGDIHVQTAGDTKEFIIRGVAHPDRIKRNILTHVDITTESSAVPAHL